MPPGDIEKVSHVLADQIDALSGALKTITFARAMLHSGCIFSVSDVQALNTTIMKWMITTPNSSKLTHMLFNVDASGEILFTIHEGADRTGGSLMTPVNHYRDNNPPGALTKVYRGVSGGTKDGMVDLAQIRSGVMGQARKTISPGESDVERYVLKRNTKYILELESFAAIYICVQLGWYEAEKLNLTRSYTRAIV